jgi:hypothetical protein
LQGFGIKEIARTGLIAMARGVAGSPPIEEKPTKAKGKKTS